MEIGVLYGFVVSLVLIGIVLGVGVLILDKMGGSSGLTNKAQLAINATRQQISDVATVWLPIIVLVAIAGLLVVLLLKGFQSSGRA